mmetsp:Transcript_1405/g.3136  ORF Transcript_1405/g.3136 Transcript_1405/m.3136 type:complete len:358 (+) Transcript_1405:58-1131(+)
MGFGLCISLLLATVVRALVVQDRHARNATTQLMRQHASLNASSWSKGWTFQSFYESYAVGRGVWKWSNSLDSYQRHFAPMAGRQLALAEVGVQSGGSLLMWQAVLGPGCHVYGIDINPECRKFVDATTTMTIGDQGSATMWNNFLASVPGIDILVDDGSHLAPHMKLTVDLVFPHIKPGGYIAVEDIHGAHYFQTFFQPLAQSISQWHIQGKVASLHLYPFELMLHKTGGANGAEFLPAAPTAVVDNFPAMWPLLAQHPGGTIAVTNPGWGSILGQPSAITEIFRQFMPLHDFSFVSTPPGCEHTSDAMCTTSVVNSQAQAQIIGVHIFDHRFVVELAPSPPVIAAVRKGTEWIKYG